MSQRFSIANLPDHLHNQISHRHLSAGEILFIANEPVDYLYYLESGSISLLHYTESGQAVYHYAVVADEFLAEVLVVAERYLCTAVVEEAAQVLVIPKQAFLDALRQNNALLLDFFNEVAHRLHMTKMMLQLRSIRLAQERVLNYLQVLAQPGNNTVPLNRSFKQMARELDLTPETFSRALAQLQEEGRISRGEGQIVLSS